MTRTADFYGYSTSTSNQRPVASLAFTEIDAVFGSIIQLDGRRSYDPEGEPLRYKWVFSQLPTNSGLSNASIRNLRADGSAVSFTPDVLGLYVVTLVVNDGELDSDPVTATVNVKLSQVPVGEGMVPDAKFLWGYISDFWNLVEDREYITTVWSAVLQSIGAEYIKLWSNDYNKSMDTIQQNVQRRWQQVTPVTDVSDQKQSVIVGYELDGDDGATGVPGGTPGDELTSLFYVPVRPAVLDADYPGSYVYTVTVGYSFVAGEDGSGSVSITAGQYTSQQLADEFNTQFGVASLDLVASDNNGYLRIESTSGGGGASITVNVSPSESDPVFGRARIVVRGQDFTQLNANFGAKGRIVVIGGQAYVIDRVYNEEVSGTTYSVLVIEGQTLYDGMVGLSWRIPQLLYTPDFDFDDAGVSAGDLLVFEVTRKDSSYSAELQAQVVGASGNRLGFEFSLEDLSTGSSTISRDLMKQLVRDLRIATTTDTELQVAGKAEALISYIPQGINLTNRPFSKYRIVFKAKKIRNNSRVPVSEDLVSMPALQEQISEPPTILRENLDYVIENGTLTFASGLFTKTSPVPESMWAEVAFYDNSDTIEGNFGRLAGLSQDDLTDSLTRAPYLSAVKGLIYAYTNGPTVANIRLGLQILLGLPFSEERGQVIEIEEDYTTDASGLELSRILVEDVDEYDRRLGIRRVYFYPKTVGLEVNGSTGVEYAVGDTIPQWSPISKGVEVLDYIKDPLWWRLALRGTEILKYFVFRVLIDSDVFDANDFQFALEFINKIKPAYTRVLIAAVLSLSDDIDIEEQFRAGLTLKLYEDASGLEATYKLNSASSAGFPLRNIDSHPFTSRVTKLLTDLVTFVDVSDVKVTSVTGWGSDDLRARQDADSPYTGAPVREGDILAIAPGQSGSTDYAWGLYEVGTVVDQNEAILKCRAPAYDPTTYDFTALLSDGFQTGTGLKGVFVRRETNPVSKASDLATSSSNNTITSSTGLFLTNGVAVGDHFIIESGANAGEYRVDATSSTPPFISETQLDLKELDGTVPSFTDASSQDYRIIRPRMMETVIEGAQVINNGGQMEVHVLDPDTSDELEAFTPGLVGTTISIYEADNSANDGEFLITGYINCGKIQTNAPADTSDSAATAVVNLDSMWHPGFEKEDELLPVEAFTAALVGVP